MRSSALSASPSERDEMKRRAAHAALSLVSDGMLVGLGSGSTAEFFLEALSEAVAEGLSIEGIASSRATASRAESLGIRLASSEASRPPDLNVDGADAMDSDLNLIKGFGGALLREKILAESATFSAILVDVGKRVDDLRSLSIPIETSRFGSGLTERRLVSLCERSGGDASGVRLRMSGDSPFVTDNGNWVRDVLFGREMSLEWLSASLDSIPGVMAHGVFLGLADAVFVADSLGVERIDRPLARPLARPVDVPRSGS